MNRALSVFRASWKVLNANALHGPRPWVFTIPLRVLHDDGNPINDDVEARHHVWTTHDQVAVQQNVGSRLLRNRTVKSATHHPSVLWILIDFAAGGWSQCTQKMTTIPETMHVGSEIHQVVSEEVWGVVLSLFLTQTLTDQ